MTNSKFQKNNAGHLLKFKQTMEILRYYGFSALSWDELLKEVREIAFKRNLPFINAYFIFLASNQKVNTAEQQALIQMYADWGAILFNENASRKMTDAVCLPDTFYDFFEIKTSTEKDPNLFSFNVNEFLFQWDLNYSAADQNWYSHCHVVFCGRNNEEFKAISIGELRNLKVIYYTNTLPVEKELLWQKFGKENCREIPSINGEIKEPFVSIHLLQQDPGKLLNLHEYLYNLRKYKYLYSKKL